MIRSSRLDAQQNDEEKGEESQADLGSTDPELEAKLREDQNRRTPHRHDQPQTNH